MTTTFQKNTQLLDELNSINLANVLNAAIMGTTGQNIVLGQDYSEEKENMMADARRYCDISSQLIKSMQI